MKLSISILLTTFILALAGFTSKAAFSDKSDGEFVTLTGKVTKVGPDAFNLKVNGKTILVEMDDYDWDADGYKLVVGDNVVVTGRVDQDFLEKKKVEAGSVYVKGLNTYFYASSADEEGAPYLTTAYSYLKTLPENALVDIQGKVTDVSGREFTIDTGFRKIKVDTKNLLYNPLDNRGYTQIDKGDRVRVSGRVEDSFFEGKEIKADFVSEIL